MNCPAVRDRLPEHALGLETARDAGALDRHLAWCAACRKEAVDLQRAAATLAFALAPAEPDPSLETAVVDAVQAVAGRRAEPRHPVRRSRVVTAAVAAGVLAVVSLGWGAVMTGRAARVEARLAEVRDHSDQDAEAARARLKKFGAVFRTQLADPQTRARIGTLSAEPQVAGAGAAMTILTRNQPDMAFVVVIGLDPATDQLPYRVWLKEPGGQTRRVGVIGELDTGGGGDVARKLTADLEGFTRVVITDAAGHAVLRGDLIQRPAPSPSG